MTLVDPSTSENKTEIGRKPKSVLALTFNRTLGGEREERKEMLKL